MSEDLYRKLQEHLHKLPMGFPPTESGVDLKLLENMFEPEEAETALFLTTVPATAVAIAAKMEEEPERVEQKLLRMGKRGLLITTRIDEEMHFIVAPYIVGMYEYQANRLDKEYVELHNQYMVESMALEVFGGKTSPFRIIPVEKSLDQPQEILPHDKVREYVMKADRIAVAQCLCRLKAKAEGRGCDCPTRTCLVLNKCAEFYLDNDLMAEEISCEEAMTILDESEKLGLVIQTQNSSGAVDYICNCCICSCGIMGAIVHLGLHSQLTRSSYHCKIDSGLCNGCGTCATRCIFNAVNADGDISSIDLRKCMGCGLCRSTCPTGAIALVKRSDERMPDVPENVQDMYDRIQSEKKRPEKFYSFQEMQTMKK